MHSAFNLFVFPNYMLTSLLLFFFFFNIYYFICKGYELSGEIALKNNHYYYYLLLIAFAKQQSPHSFYVL